MAKPIRIFYSTLSQRFYASRSYKEEGKGLVTITGEKFDVTNELVALVKHHNIKFDDYKIKEKQND